MNKSTYLILALFLIGASCSNLASQKPGSIQNTNINSTISDEPAVPKNFDETSLQTLAGKELNGNSLTLGKTLAETTSYTRRYITYQSGSLLISGILNIPKGTPPKDGWPVLFLNHGYIDTSVYTNGRGLRREQDFLAKNGFAVLHSDYRNHAESDKDPNEEYNFRLGYTEDVINAVMAVKNSNFSNLSKEKFGMLGHSMGGGITQNILVTKPDLIKAAVLYAPVSGQAEESYERWTKSRPEIAQAIANKYGLPTETLDFWKNISAENFYSQIQTPMLYFHGNNDKDVPIDWSRRSVKILQELGKQAELVEYENQPHEFTPPTWNNFMQDCVDFFRRNL
ncbi:MAG: alpha/beta fold hydrolase [Candidatus Doudnabacteria bacterium]|nr:alpha/beta fold hydrolase [Candidatus Doudnabacteria bacterium]